MFENDEWLGFKMWIRLYLLLIFTCKREGSLEEPLECLLHSRQVHLGGSSLASKTHPSLFGDHPLH